MARQVRIAQHVGVDGCKTGWLAVTRNGARLVHGLFASIGDLASAFRDAERILIDIPIGLPWADVPIRPCDRLARRALGKTRKSSVFPVPCREALTACDLDCARTLNKACVGRSVGAQTWGISPKIAEVDGFLLANRGHHANIREVHPEVCFWALAGRRPMMHSKTTREGREERLRVLQRYEPSVGSFLNAVLSATLRKDVWPDDVLDAVVAFVTAEARHGELASLSGDPSRDVAGLPIEMLYLRTCEEIA